MNFNKVDLVINFTVNSYNYKYHANKVAKGLKFFPVKPELKNIRLTNINKFSKVIENILIIIGGNDIYKVGEKILLLMDRIFEKVSINLIELAANDLIILPSKNKNHLYIIPPTFEIEEYFCKSDLVITGGGLAKYEAAYCCIPNATLSQTEEQNSETQFFTKEFLTYDLGLAKDFNDNKIRKGLIHLKESKVREKIYNNARKKFITDSLANLTNNILSLK